MAEQNRFAGMMGGLGKGADNEPKETAKAEKTTKPAVKPAAKIEAKAKPKGKRTTVKSKDPGYVQMGLYLPEKLHQRMKAAAALNGLEMSDVAAQAIELWLSKNAPNL